MIRRRDHDLGNSTETARSGAKLNDERDIDKDEEPDFLDQDDQDQVIRDLEEKIHQQQVLVLMWSNCFPCCAIILRHF